MGLALVRDLREARTPQTDEEIEDFEVDVMAGFAMARMSAGIGDASIRSDTTSLEQVRDWFGRPLWEMRNADADTYFGKVLRAAKPATRTRRAAALSVYFQYLELRHAVEIHNLTGRPVECPLDEMNRPPATVHGLIRVPPSEDEMEHLFTGWREDLVTCRKFAPAARNYAVARMSADVGLRINEAVMLDLDDARWDLGQFGKLNVRYGKGARRRGAKPRLVPLINGADTNLRWYIEDVWGQLDADPDRPGAPMFPSERKASDGSGKRASDDVFRRALAQAVDAHLPSWAGKLTPHVLRHYCASELYAGGMDFLAIQDLLGHSWTSSTARYIHVRKTHVEDAWITGQQRAANRWGGLAQ